jgi:Na+/H+ antiporter NhaD/arsenite permease-like protein
VTALLQLTYLIKYIALLVVGSKQQKKRLPKDMLQAEELNRKEKIVFAKTATQNFLFIMMTFFVGIVK